MEERTTVAVSTWAPLRQSTFRALWVAGLVSNLGAWMHQVGEAWLMTSMTSSPLLVATLESADSLAIFLLATPAGALADVVNRRGCRSGRRPCYSWGRSRSGCSRWAAQWLENGTGSRLARRSRR